MKQAADSEDGRAVQFAVEVNCRSSRVLQAPADLRVISVALLVGGPAIAADRERTDRFGPVARNAVNPFAFGRVPIAFEYELRRDLSKPKVGVGTAISYGKAVAKSRVLRSKNDGAGSDKSVDVPTGCELVVRSLGDRNRGFWLGGRSHIRPADDDHWNKGTL